MNERDIINALSDPALRRQASEAYMKTAGAFGDGVKGMAQWAGRKVVENIPEIAAALTGAVVAGAGQYALSRPRKGGKPSIDQTSMHSMDAATKRSVREAAKSGRPLSFHEEIQKAVTPALAGIADAGAKHPGKSALMAVPAGALAGLALLKHLK
jgi:hypothetical protein